MLGCAICNAVETYVILTGVIAMSIVLAIDYLTNP